MKTIYLGADHAGFKLKEKIKSWLDKKKIKYEDLGNLEYDKKDDYPRFAEKVAKKVAKEKSVGLLLCGSGQGVCIAANKIKSIRAVVAEHIKDAYLARKDDDANILCLEGRTLKVELAQKIIIKFLETEFENIPRRVRRINEIKKLEQKRR